MMQSSVVNDGAREFVVSLMDTHRLLFTNYCFAEHCTCNDGALSKQRYLAARRMLKGWLEFAGVENDGPSKNRGWNLQDWKMTDWKNDGLENDW